MNLLKKSLLAAGFCALTAQADVSYTPVNANATEGAPEALQLPRHKLRSQNRFRYDDG